MKRFNTKNLKEQETETTGNAPPEHTNACYQCVKKALLGRGIEITDDILDQVLGDPPQSTGEFFGTSGKVTIDWWETLASANQFYVMRALLKCFRPCH
tara:strand:+ start:63 stop:356 length:294 start_codon:yes stop_codon:yes gene_type:complete